MSSTLYTAIPRFAKASVADTVSQLSVRMSVVFYTNSTWTKRTVHTATMELTLTVTHTKYRSKYPRHSNNSLGQNWLDMSHNVCHYRRIAVALAADGRGNCCGWTSAKAAVAIAADFRGLRVSSIIIVFCKTIKLTLILTLTHTEYRPKCPLMTSPR